MSLRRTARPSRRPALALAVLLATAAVAEGAGAQQARGDSATALMNGGYERLRGGDRAGAIALFRQAVTTDGTRADARRELAYLLLAADERAAAIRELEALVRLGADGPRDHLQLGYLLTEARRSIDAVRSFRHAAASPDTAIAAPARRALGVLAASGFHGRGTRYSELYAAPVYQTRFSNLVSPLILRHGVVVVDGPRASAYASLRGTRDTRSRGGAQPVVFSDNAVVPAIGFKVQPMGPALALYGEAGVALPLAGGPDASARADVRAGVLVGARVGDDERQRARRYADFYADASYYSRFDHDVIAYAQARPTLRALATDRSAVELFAQASVVGDTRGAFYNNVGEASAGIALTPWKPLGLVLRGEAVRGRYLAGTGGGHARDYDDVRITAIVGHYRLSPRRF